MHLNHRRDRPHVAGALRFELARCILRKKRREEERSAESFPYFYQVFRGDEYLRGADLICARGFAGRRVSQSSPSPFFFFLPVPFMLRQAEEEVGKVKEVGASQRWRNNGGRSAGGCVAAVHVSLNILRPLSALDRGNSDNNFISLFLSLSLFVGRSTCSCDGA